MLERIFKLKERQTNVKTEILAGITTFMALAYIIFVNPNILADAGIPKDAAIAATILSTAVATTLMGLWANYPVAVAPGMGLNAFFAYYVVGSLGLSWQVALGAVFVSGVFFLILTIGGIRQAIIRAVPENLKSAIVVGIGMFIAYIGLKNAGFIMADKATFVSLGHVSEPSALLAALGLIIVAVLMARNIKGAILISILVVTILGMALSVIPAPKGINDIVSLSLPHVGPTFLQMDLAGAFQFGIFSIIFTFTMVELFDNMGTLIGITKKAGLMKKDGTIENLDRALTTDSVGTMISAALGTSTVTSYIESATGIAEGGKTGLTAITIAVLFLIALVFAPLIGLVPAFATAPALIIVGAMMMAEVRSIDFEDITEGLPAFLTIIMMPLTASIASGFAFGFVSYTLLKAFSGKIREISLVMWGISICFLINFYLRLH